MTNTLSKKILSSLESYPKNIQFKALYEALYQFCKDGGLGDPYSFFRSAEILICNELGLKVSPKNSGADAYLNGLETEENSVEIKTTRSPYIQATYTGLSMHSTWAKQKDYLIKEKIGIYPYHFFCRLSNSKVEEMWRMESEDVLKIILPKVKSNYYPEGKFFTQRKDPRPRAKINKNEILKYGVQVI